MAQKTEKKVSLRPIGSRLVAKRTEEKEVTKGGIILPESARQKQETAVVIAIGTGEKDKDGKTIAIPVSVGDTILIDKYAGQEVDVEGEKLIIVKLEDVVALIVEE